MNILASEMTVIKMTTGHLEEDSFEDDDLMDLVKLLLGLIPHSGVYGALKQLGETFHVHPHQQRAASEKIRRLSRSKYPNANCFTRSRPQIVW